MGFSDDPVGVNRVVRDIISIAAEDVENEKVSKCWCQGPRDNDGLVGGPLGMSFFSWKLH